MLLYFIGNSYFLLISATCSYQRISANIALKISYKKIPRVYAERNQFVKFSFHVEHCKSTVFNLFCALRSDF
jgi:hypothetical protein